MAKKKTTSFFEIDWLTIPIIYIKIGILIILGLISFGIYWFYFRTSTAQSVEKTEVVSLKEATAKFIYIEGDVQVKKADLYVWKPADYRMDLNEGDLIKTAPNSHARIEFKDKTVVDITSDTMVRVEQEKTEEYQNKYATNIEYGIIDLSVPEEKKDDSIVRAGPMTTEFTPGSEGQVRSDPERNIRGVDLHKGEARVISGGEKVNLSTSEGIRVKGEKIVEKVKLPPAPILKLPANGSVFEFQRPDYLELELSWYDIESAKSYRVYLSSKGDIFTENPYEVKTNSVKAKFKVSPKTRYWWAVSAIDENNNESPKSQIWSFTLQKSIVLAKVDKVPPYLKITEVEPYLPFINIKGETEPDADLRINGEKVDVTPDGKFDYFYRLRKAGVNEIYVVAEDAAGNKTEKKIVRNIE